MTVDNTKSEYSSLWDIDQIIDRGTTTVGSGTTAIHTLSDANYPSTHEVQFKPTGSTKWYEVGQNATSNTIATLFTFYTYTLGSSLYVVTSSAGTVRHFVWQDKLNYD